MMTSQPLWISRDASFNALSFDLSTSIQISLCLPMISERSIATIPACFTAFKSDDSVFLDPGVGIVSKEGFLLTYLSTKSSICMIPVSSTVRFFSKNNYMLCSKLSSCSLLSKLQYLLFPS